MTPEPDARAVLDLLEEATQSPEQSLASDQELGSLEGWDSLGMVMFIGLVKQNFSVELSVHDLRESKTAGDLAERVASKTTA